MNWLIDYLALAFLAPAFWFGWQWFFRVAVGFVVVKLIETFKRGKENAGSTDKKTA
jgi:asparagine N-glycosylation enzyme membrane subunit Stt3